MMSIALARKVCKGSIGCRIKLCSYSRIVHPIFFSCNLPVVVAVLFKKRFAKKKKFLASFKIQIWLVGTRGYLTKSDCEQFCNVENITQGVKCKIINTQYSLGTI